MGEINVYRIFFSVYL